MKVAAVLRFSAWKSVSKFNIYRHLTVEQNKMLTQQKFIYQRTDVASRYFCSTIFCLGNLSGSSISTHRVMVELNKMPTEIICQRKDVA